jgi:hypothetical protein
MCNIHHSIPGDNASLNYIVYIKHHLTNLWLVIKPNLPLKALEDKIQIFRALVSSLFTLLMLKHLIFALNSQYDRVTSSRRT